MITTTTTIIIMIITIIINIISVMIVNKMRNLVVIAALLSVTHVAGQGDTHCLDNVNACVPRLRARLIDNNYYWFGTPYFTYCPAGAFCFNFRPDLQSIMSRVLVTNNTATLQNAVANIQVLNVTFEHPAGK
ncbi:hypothetical protein ElyMa_006911100 [Elysia marginata]|uniref:Uncharacterized protein n=1 Tax=Elysia marginata TaxID=1093978 RepID=A0AAV4JE04_9GAST|nr:hypothetical protein ElyMa_006911100 [Elysia marginata]